MSVISQLPFHSKTLLLLKTDLEEQRDRLVRTLEKLHSDIRNFTDCAATDLIDASSGNSWAEATFATYAQNRSRLLKIEDALRRIASGEFGTCLVCGGIISVKRLKALPWASSCIECQQRSEQTVVH